MNDEQGIAEGKVARPLPANGADDGPVLRALPETPDVLFQLPSAPLRDFITAFYAIEVRGALTDHLHPEWGNIRFPVLGNWFAESLNGSGDVSYQSALFGPTDRTRRFGTTGGIVIGVGLTPVGWVRIMRRDASKVANAFIPLSDRLGRPGDAIGEELSAAPDFATRCAVLDTLFSAFTDQPVTDDERLAIEAQRILMADTIETVSDFAIAMGLSYPTLNRLCLRVFGFGPKRLFRRQRFLRTLAMIRNRLDQPLSAVLDTAYYDQAHFIREFRAYMGMTPTAYFNSPREVLRRATEERQRVVGAPMQVLHGS